MYLREKELNEILNLRGLFLINWGELNKYDREVLSSFSSKS